MAGYYQDVPGRRSAIDESGLILHMYPTVNGNPETAPYTSPVIDQATAGDLILINSETRQQWSGNTNDTVNTFGFPEAYDLDGVLSTHSGQGLTMRRMDYSTDSTNGEDGTWTNINNPYPNQNPQINMQHRIRIGGPIAPNATGYVAFSAGAVRWVRLFREATFGGQQHRNVHVYGQVAANQTPDRLLYIDATLGLPATVNEFALSIDLGDKPRGSVIHRDFYLWNNSDVNASLTANSVDIRAQSLTMGSSGWLSFSENGDGGPFSGILTLAASIAPGTASPLLTVKVDINDAAELWTHAPRIRVLPGSWT